MPPAELSVSTPVAALYELEMLPYVDALVFVKCSASSAVCKFPVIDTVALTAVVELPSVSVMPESMATGVDAVLSPATNDVVPPVAVSVGGADGARYVKLSSVGEEERAVAARLHEPDALDLRERSVAETG